MAGVESLLQMPPDELRVVIAKRVELLDTELKEREGCRKAIDEVLAAQQPSVSRPNASAARSILGALLQMQCLWGLSSFRCSKASLDTHKKALQSGALFL
jgi:hypothetical protein